MKIDRVNNPYDIYLDKNIKAKDAKSPSKGVVKGNGVNVQISDTAKALIDKIGQTEDTSFSEKVEKIRKSILAGNYKVSPDKISEKIMDYIDSQEGSERKWV